MKYFLLILVLGAQFVLAEAVLAQKNFGALSSETSYDRTIEISTYHQYELNLKQGAIALLNMTDFDVRTELTVVSPQGFIVEQINTAETADFLIFEATAIGKYQLYIKTNEGEQTRGKYTITAHYLSADDSGKIGQIRQLLQLLEKPNRAGAVTAIVENNEIVFQQVYGFSNVEHLLKNNDATVFELASVSKQFTAMAIAKLAEQGKLSVEDDIRKYFPELPIYRFPIKVKHLLNHTSGIIDSEYPLALAGFENDPIGIDRVLNFLKNTPGQYFESGTAFSYSNDGYTLLAELVNRVTQQDFNTWMKLNVFNPLEMNSTLIRDSPELVIPNRATSYVSYTGDAHFRRLSFDFFAPGGCSVRSSLADLVKWVNFLNQGYHAQEKLFQRINRVETFENGDSMSYAYGNFITEFRGHKRISHLGLSAGFTTSVARFPEQNLSFIFLGNDGEFRNYYLARKIYEIYLEEKLSPITKPFEGIETAAPPKEEQAKNNLARKEVNLGDYEGSYFSQEINASYSFQVIRDTLFALSAAYQPIPIMVTGKDSLATDEDFMEVIFFKRDFEGRISECQIANSDDEHLISFVKISVAKHWAKANHWKSTGFLQNMRDTLAKIEASKILTGFGVAVFDETETFFQAGFGFADVESNKDYNPETIQLIASISKSVTGVAIMKAMELGFFELDDPINDYLPFEVSNPLFPDELITIRHLLTHTSSLDDPENYKRGYVFTKHLEEHNWPAAHHEKLHYYNDNEAMSLIEFLNELAAPTGKWYDATKMYTKEKPGTNFEYSNLGFALLGYILEVTTNVDFKDFTQQYIFDPLDMNITTWELEKVDATNHATYYIENYNSCPDYSINTIPDGGLYTNVIDLTKFLQEAIRGYAGRGQLLTQSSYAEMFRSQSDLFEIEGGLGWDLSIPCCIGHAGNDFGTSTVMYFEPNTGIGRIILSNISIEREVTEDTFYGMMGLLFKERF